MKQLSYKTEKEHLAWHHKYIHKIFELLKKYERAKFKRTQKKSRLSANGPLQEKSQMFNPFSVSQITTNILFPNTPC
jgi:hypothetical protein